ncbi:MAG: hypothetical protein GQ574_08305 [Crocinitomix sp.]|nr:hypothetical protein [Crocinitomix sp.]
MNQSRQEHLKRAAEQIKKAKEFEAVKEQEYFKKITSGTRWKIFTFFTFFCVLLALLTTIDTFVDGKTVKLREGEFRFDRSLGAMDYQSVWVNENDLFMVHFQNLQGKLLNTFEVTESFIFRDYKYLSFIREYEDTVTPLERTRMYASKRISIYDWFPLTQVLLFIPLLVLLFKRQKPWFNFAQMACFILIFPGSLVLLYSLIF